MKLNHFIQVTILVASFHAPLAAWPSSEGINNSTISRCPVRAPIAAKVSLQGQYNSFIARFESSSLLNECQRLEGEALIKELKDAGDADLVDQLASFIRRRTLPKGPKIPGPKVIRPQ